jgi:HSP20 family molecular chaperone IbpA
MSDVQIPMDVYESPREIVIIIPLGGVQKKSVEMYFEDYNLIITGKRTQPKIKDDLLPLQQECYWWEFHQQVELPPHIYYDRIQSTISPENILQIIVPKSLKPEKMKLDIWYK